MKSINKLILENFKFFNGIEEFSFNGKNILIYGENGSGKSSIYWALYTFFQSSLKNNDEIKKYFDSSNSQNLVNRFAKNNDNSRITLQLIDRNKKTEDFTISKTLINTNIETDTQIEEAMKASDFINYRLLSRLYDFRNPEPIDLFEIFEKEVMDYLYLDDKTVGEIWKELKKGLNPKPRMTSLLYKDFQNKITLFNQYFEKLIPSLLKNTNQFLKNDFQEDMEISIEYQESTYNNFIRNTKKRNSKTIAPKLLLTVKLLNNDLEDSIVHKPHTFLNEAKLTAISLSLRFSILKSRLIADFRILVLDDLLISLDMSYRIEVINILLKHFDNFQLIIMTHDKGFYQLLRQKISRSQWEMYELYNKDNKQCVKKADTNFDRAKKLFEDRNYEASANFLRKETEEILKHYLDPNLKYINREFINLESLIKKVKQEIEEDYIKIFDRLFRDRNIGSETISKIGNFENIELEKNVKEQLYQARADLFKFFIEYHKYKDSEIKIFNDLKEIKDRILNPSSHYSEAPIFKKEIEDAIKLIGRLREFLKDKESNKSMPLSEPNCSKKNGLKKNTEILKKLNEFVIDFIDDVLDKIIEIKTSEELDVFLEKIILINISNFSQEEFNQIMEKFKKPNVIHLFVNSSAVILKKIFQNTEWSLDERIIWCNFLQSLIYNPIDDNIFEWFENRNCLKINYDYNDSRYINCDFLDDEIPF